MKNILTTAIIASTLGLTGCGSNTIHIENETNTAKEEVVNTMCTSKELAFENAINMLKDVEELTDYTVHDVMIKYAYAEPCIHVMSGYITRNDDTTDNAIVWISAWQYKTDDEFWTPINDYKFSTIDNINDLLVK